VAVGATFYDHAARARRSSRLLLLIAIVLASGAGAAIGGASSLEAPTQALASIGAGALVGGGIGLVAALFAASGVAGSLILSSLRAREIGANPSNAGEKRLRNVVDELTIAASIPAPRLYLIEDEAINALATGGSPEHASIAVTSGALTQLDREELAGVIAHELAHVRNYDIRFGLYLAGIAGLFALLADLALNIFHLFGRGSRRSSEGGGLMIVVLIIALIVGALGSLGLLLIRAASSRNRELLADASAVELTRNPDGLTRALAKIANAADRTVDTASSGSAHLFFADPKSAISGLLSTHPPLIERINALRAISGKSPIEEEEEEEEALEQLVKRQSRRR
jgi:heat shock protein HtpX